jgi:hypothetical protein
MNDCCLMPNERFFSYIMVRTSYVANNEVIMMSSLYYTNTVSWIFIFLAHFKKKRSADNMSLHSDTLSWFWASQYFLFLLNAACLAESNKYQFDRLHFWPDWGSSPHPTVLWEHDNHYTTDVLNKIWL